MRSEIVNKFPRACSEFFNSAQETHNQPPALIHPEEITWVNPYAALKQFQHGLLIRLHRRNSQHRVPAALNIESSHQILQSESPVQLSQVCRHTLSNLPLDAL